MSPQGSLIDMNCGAREATSSEMVQTCLRIKVAASNEMPLILKEHEGACRTNLNLKYLNVISDFPNLVCLWSCIPTHAPDFEDVDYFQEERIPKELSPI